MPQAQQGNNIADSAQINPSTILSSDIADDEIVNADVDSAAAIAYSKLALNNSITNADLAGSIADSKLNQITTASKVHGSSLTGLASIPAGAGVIPSANIPTQAGDLVVFLSWAECKRSGGTESGGGVSDISYYRMADGATSQCDGIIKVPKGATSISSIQAILSTSVNTGNWYGPFGAVHLNTDAAATVDADGGAGNSTTAANAVANTYYKVALTATLYDGLGSIDEDDLIALCLGRIGAHGNDTMSGNLDFVGFLVTFA